MTQIKTQIKYSIDNDVYLKCVNHAGDHDICTIISTLCNVLTIQGFKAGIDPIKYEGGEFEICIPDASDEDKAVADVVIKTMQAAEIPIERLLPDMG